MGFWRKLAKIAAIAAPIVAAPFTGGMSLALIGAGSGAANAALSGGGWKRYLADIGLGIGSGFGSQYLSKIGQGANLANAPALGSTEAGVIPGVTLGQAGVQGIARASAGDIATGIARTAAQNTAKNAGRAAMTRAAAGLPEDQGLYGPAGTDPTQGINWPGGTYFPVPGSEGDMPSGDPTQGINWPGGNNFPVDGLPDDGTETPGVRSRILDALKNVGKKTLSGLRSNGGLNAALVGSSGMDMLAAYLSARAAKQASDQQFEFGQQALQFEKDRYANSQANFKPWIDTGQQAVGTLGSALMPTSGPAPTADNLAGQWIGGLQANAKNNGRSLVSMRAPTGEIKQVADFQVPHYMAAGARVV